ncbi:hypothetical protein ACOMHN_024121 [Nucella lapillus]
MEDIAQAMPTTPALLSDSGDGFTTTAESGINTTANPVDPTLWIVSRYLWKICPPFILLFGLFGNVMIILIMRRMSSSESSISIYFTATAVMDILYLTTDLLSRWMWLAFSFNVLALHTAVCKIFTWIYTGGGTIGCWCLVCMTVQRAMSVVWPHRVNLLCTRRTVLTLVIGITLFFAALYSHYLVGFESFYYEYEKAYICTSKPGYKTYNYFTERIFVYIELSVYCLIPFAILVVSNIILVWKLAASVKAASKHLTGTTDSAQIRAREKSANSVTLTVIVVSSAFIVLTLPASVNYIVHYFAISHLRLKGEDLNAAQLINAVCALLGHTNSAVNFYLYCLTGRKFRKECVSILTCWSKKQ